VTESAAPPPFDVGDYCRQIEDHLTRVNGGHLVRVVGPAFELVCRWADAGVPLSVVFRGIERKAARRREGRPGRPLRLEFCEGEVVALFDAWRRAIGIGAGATAGDAGPSRPSRRPSLAGHVRRAIDRMGRASGRVNWPDDLRDAADRLVDRLGALVESARRTRGGGRADVEAQLSALDAELVAAARAAVPAGLLADLGTQAERELALFRDRLSGDAWRRSVEVTVDRLLRDRLGLPTLVP